MSSHSRFVTVNIYRREYLTLDHTGRLRTRSSSTFKGMYKGVAYNTSTPPGKIFSNHNLCIEFNQFIGEYTSACAFARGHVKIWGKAGEVEPPQLVLSLLVEPSKPRLCLDARFSITFGWRTRISPEINCWWSPGSCAQYRFLSFGWENSLYVYQSIGLFVLSYSREQGIACSLYIDDPCVGEILSNKVFWARPITHRSKESSLRSTESALYIVCWVFIWLGYFLDLSKCVLQPVTQIRYLGLVIDSCQ